MQGVINGEVDRMLEEGVIERSTSPWSSPIVMVKKPSGQHRLCEDLRRVNDLSVKDAYPLPQINAILDKLRDARYISTLDLRQGYWQVPLAAASRPITAFTVPGRGLFQFCVMPFGLHSAGATFQRLLDTIIGPEMEPRAFAYLDDIIILGSTLEEHLDSLRDVFNRLRNAGLVLNPEKCKFGQKELRYLGHVINGDGVHTDPGTIKAIVDYPTPSRIKELRSFLGLASWYRRFVPNFSSLAAPLNKLLRKSTRWAWEEQQQKAFEQLKGALTRTPVLAGPDYTLDFTLQTDASDLGLGAALTQTDTEGERVVAYASRSLTEAERRYTVTEKECLAIIYGLRKFRPYLEGYHCRVLTDHQSLKWLLAIPNPTGRLARWVMEMQQFDLTIVYRKGSMNLVADALSRQPVECGLVSDPNKPEDYSDDGWVGHKMRQVTWHPDRWPDYRVENNKLYRHLLSRHSEGDPSLVNDWKLCIPKPMRTQVLKECHDEPTAGHLGILKTFFRIARNYYWPGCFKDTARYVRRCEQCHRYKAAQQAPYGQMGKARRNVVPWEQVSTDLVGPLPRSKRGHAYILIFQDTFTKWVECRAIRKATASAVAAGLREQVLMRFGTPKRLISDNGKQYVGRVFRRMAQETGINVQYTPPYSPQANPVERANRTLKTMIAMFVKGDHREWDQHLPELTFAMNTATHSSTGYSPAFLNFGRELTPPGAIYNRGQENQPSDTSTPGKGTQLRHLRTLAEIRQLVLHHLSKSHANQCRYYNLRRRPFRPKVGMSVYTRSHRLSSAADHVNAKLEPKFTGPHQVTKVISTNIVEVHDVSGQKKFRCHVKDIKLQPETDAGTDMPEPPP